MTPAIVAGATSSSGREARYDVSLVTREARLIETFRDGWEDERIEVLSSVEQLLHKDLLQSSVYVLDARLADIELFQAALTRYGDAIFRTWYLLTSHSPEPWCELLLPSAIRIMSLEQFSPDDLVNIVREEVEREGQRHITAMRYLSEAEGFAIRMGSGRRYFLPLAHVPEADSSPVQEVAAGEDDSYYVVRQSSGNTFEIPWDDVLYHCEPTYEYFRYRSESYEQDTLRIGQRIHNLRKQNGLTITRLALLSGMKRPNLSRLEHGKHRPSLETLERIAGGLGVPVAELVRRDQR